MFETIQIQNIGSHIVHLKLNRPKQRNAMNVKMVNEIPQLMEHLQAQAELRCIIITGNGKHFSSGVDLQDPVFAKQFEASDTARKSIQIYSFIKYLQSTFNSLEKVNVPILIGIHNACLGLAAEFVLAGDYRVCTKNSIFEFKEVDLGIAADMGLLQRLQYNCGNQSLVRELVYSGRKFDANTALQLGMVSTVYENEEQMEKELIQKAQDIADKSPVAIWTIKNMCNKQKHDFVLENLDYLARINSSCLQTNDIMESLNAFIQKEKAIYPKL